MNSRPVIRVSFDFIKSFRLPFFLLFAFIFSPAAWAAYPGDINQNDEVSIADAILALKIVSNDAPTSAVDMNADVGGDQKIGLSEAVYILKALSQNKPPQIQEINPAAGLPGSNLTVSGTEFDAQAAVSVRFFNESGYSVTVGAIDVTETSLTVSVPAYINPESGTLTQRTVSVQLVQKAGGILTLSNVITGYEIQGIAVPDGALTLSLLQASADTGRRLLYDIAGTEMDTVDFHTTLLNQIALIDTIVADIRELISGSTGSFYLGTLSDTPINVTASDLKLTDSILLSVLLVLGNDTAMAVKTSSEKDLSILSSVKAIGDCQQIESRLAAAGALSGDPDLDNLARDVVYAPRISSNCKSVEAFLTAEKIWAGAGAAAVGLLFLAGAPEIAIALPVAGMLYVTLESAMGMTAIGGALGQETAGAFAMVQEGVAKLETLMKFGPLKAAAPKVGAIAGIYYGARSLMEEFSKTVFPTPTTTTTTTTTSTTSTTSTTIHVPTPGTYTGAVTGFLTETIDCAQWKDEISATIVITLTGNGTLIDPYTGSMSINGTALSTCEYCTCDPGCDPAPGETYEFPFSDIGEVSGSLGQIEAYISGDVGTAVFDASFKEGTVSGNTLTGILTFGSGGAVDAPFVKSVTLTKQ